MLLGGAILFFVAGLTCFLNIIEALGDAASAVARRAIWRNWENTGGFLAALISLTLFAFWLKHRLNDRKNRICFGTCVLQKEELVGDKKTKYRLDVVPENGKRTSLYLDWEDYAKVKKGDRIYILTDPDGHVLFVWSAQYYGLCEELLPLLSEKDRQRERSASTENAMRRLERKEKPEANQEARNRGEVSEEDRKAARTNRILIWCSLAALLLLSLFIPGGVVAPAFLIVLGIPFNLTEGEEQVRVSKAYWKARKEQDLYEPEPIIQ